MRKVYAVYANSDMTEGRGPMHLVCIYDNPEAAVQHIRQAKGVMGYGKPENVVLDQYGYYAYGNDHAVRETFLLYSFAERKMQLKKDAVAAVLKKLTKEEIRLLGLAE